MGDDKTKGWRWKTWSALGRFDWYKTDDSVKKVNVVLLKQTNAARMLNLILFFTDVIFICFSLFALLYSGRVPWNYKCRVLEFQRYVDFFWIIFEVFRSNLDNVIWIFWYFYFNKMVCSDRTFIYFVFYKYFRESKCNLSFATWKVLKIMYFYSTSSSLLWDL